MNLGLYRRLSKEHIKVSDAGKMRNHLAICVLNWDMVDLMKAYQATLEDVSILNATLALLQQTSVHVEIFSNNNAHLTSVYDPCIQKLLQVLDFSHIWENEFNLPKEKARHLISRQTREDIDSSIYGFIEIVKLATKT